MCLRVRNNVETCIAADDIECYKVFLRYKSGTFRSPYQLMDYTKYINATDIDERTVNDEHEEFSIENRGVDCGGNPYCDYGCGLLHSFSMRIDTYMTANYLLVYGKSEITPVVYRCTIPKGTIYVRGRDSNGYASYASRQLVIGEEMKNEELRT